MPSAAATKKRSALRRAAVRATFAPSLLNSQPWRLRLSRQMLEIHVDPARQMGALDPIGRQMTVSCGCAVFNARAALTSAGYDPRVTRFPDPGQPNLIARIEASEHLGAAVDGIGALDSWIEGRRSNRRQFADDAVPAEIVDALFQAARAEGAELMQIEHPSPWLTTALLHSQGDQPENLGAGLPVEQQCLLLLGTRTDTPNSWVQAGEALERVLLEVASRGYAASLATEVIEVAASNAMLRREQQLSMFPHVLLRVGRAPTTPATRRRRLVDMLEDAG